MQELDSGFGDKAIGANIGPAWRVKILNARTTSHNTVLGLSLLIRFEMRYEF